MISRSTLLHLRIPFSLYLMPVFCFAATEAYNTELWAVFYVFFILHFLLYPASNGYNSFYDKDEESIGGLEKPPVVSKDLLIVSLLLDGVAMFLGLFLSWQFAIMLFIYGLVSKAYSHPKIRLKKYSIISWLTAGIFQGAFTFIMVYQVLMHFGFTDLLINFSKIILPATLSSIMIFGFYPLTQVYQHKEDRRRGDNTISILLGIKGTFIFSAIMFIIAVVGFAFFYLNISAEIIVFNNNFSVNKFVLFILFMLPTLSYFLYWFNKVLINEKNADFKNTMRLNKIASVSLILFFLLINSR